MIKDLNELLDKNLKLICEAEEQQMFMNDFLVINDKRLYARHTSHLFADQMRDKGLVTIINELCIAAEYGYEIYLNG